MNNDSPLSDILNNSCEQYLKTWDNLGRSEYYRIHDIFICYYKNMYYDNAKAFIDNQFMGKPINNEETTSIAPLKHKKLKVNLSVPQLAYLFRLLYDVKPDIFENISKRDITNFIVDNFITKGSAEAGMSSDNLYKHFIKPENTSANFWVDKLTKMIKDTRNYLISKN